MKLISEIDQRRLLLLHKAQLLFELIELIREDLKRVGYFLVVYLPLRLDIEKLISNFIENDWLSTVSYDYSL